MEVWAKYGCDNVSVNYSHSRIESDYNFKCDFNQNKLIVTVKCWAITFIYLFIKFPDVLCKKCTFLEDLKCYFY